MLLEKIKKYFDVYYSTDNGILLHGDCLEIMKKLPCKSIDLVLTDIPFNVGWKYKGSNYDDKKTEDEYYKQCIIWFSFISKVSKSAIIKIPTKFSYIVLPAFNNTIGYKWTIIQYSPNTTSHGVFNLHLYTQYIVSNNTPKKPNIDLFINTKNKITREHPACMPVEPIIKLLNMFSKDDNLILDPFLGSGTTAVACEKMGRRWIGIEISEEYCKIAKERIEQERKQLKLEL